MDVGERIFSPPLSFLSILWYVYIIMTYNNSYKDEISRLRQRVFRLHGERKRLLDRLSRPKEMIEGSLYDVYKKCGNKRCRCAGGQRHGPFKYLSLKIANKMKLTFIRRKDEPWVIPQAKEYKRYQRDMATLRKKDNEITKILAAIRDFKLKRYE